MMSASSRSSSSVVLVSLVSLLWLAACTGDGDEAASSGTDSSGEGDTAADTETSAEGNEGSMGDGDPGDGDGDPGDGDGDPGKCGAMDAAGEGPCEAILGAAWDGETCVELSGCECVGDDCAGLFEDLKACLDAYAECFDKTACAGLEQKDCTDTRGCMPILGQELLLTDNGQWCALESSYLGCSSEQGCDDAISFACPDDADGVFQTPDSCIPDLGWTPCQPPSDQGFYESC